MNYRANRIWNNPPIPSIPSSPHDGIMLILNSNEFAQKYYYQGCREQIISIMRLANSKVSKISVFIWTMKILLVILSIILASISIQSALFLNIFGLILYSASSLLSIAGIRLLGFLYLYIMRIYSEHLQELLSKRFLDFRIKVSSYCLTISVFEKSLQKTYHIFLPGQIIHSGTSYF